LRKHQTGAALLAVLVVSISLSVLMGYTSIRMQQRLAVAEAAKVKLTDLAAVTQKLSELTYLLATQRITAAGVSQGSNAEGIKKDDDGHWLYQLTNDELRADGHKYQASGVEFSIQNESGLIPINSSTQYWLKKWLSSNGFDYSRKNKLAAIVADYADPDEIRRPGGAEYEVQGPGNYLLQSCRELLQLDRWRTLLEQQPDFINNCTLRRTPTLNLNAVPNHLWQDLWPDSAAKISQARETGSWLLQDNDFLQFEPGMLSLDSDLYSRQGGRGFRVNVGTKSASKAVRIQIEHNKNMSYSVRTVR